MAPSIKSRRPSSPSSPARNLSISLLPNQTIHRSTFLGSSIPSLSSPTTEQTPCEACAALHNTGEARRASLPSNTNTYKRHAVILPIRHQGRLCSLPNELTSLEAWERLAMSASASASASSSANSSPATSPTRERGSPGLRAESFDESVAQSANVSRFSVDTIAPSSSSPVGAGFPSIVEEGEEELLTAESEEQAVLFASQGFLRLL
ncbi:hypothetical protein MBLNU457_6512t1 [Dothideomycetes sp. NU457]